MTKLRPPISFARSLGIIAGDLGWDGCAAVLGKSESYVRKLSDPDIEREISLRDARRLDAAFRRAGGSGAPLLECYAFQLELGGEDPAAPAEAVLVAIGATAKEFGEAAAASLDAIKNGNCPSTRLTALREVEEAVESLNHLARLLGAQKLVDGG